MAAAHLGLVRAMLTSPTPATKDFTVLEPSELHSILDQRAENP